MTAAPDGKWTHGKAAIRDRWSEMLTDPGFKLTWTVDKADASKDGLFGYTRGTFQGSMGGKPMAGSYATVWEKGKDGKWRAVVTIAAERKSTQLVSQIASSTYTKEREHTYE